MEKNLRFSYFSFYCVQFFIIFFFCAAKKLRSYILFTLTVPSCNVSQSVLLFYKHFYNILFYCLNSKS